MCVLTSCKYYCKCFIALLFSSSSPHHPHLSVTACSCFVSSADPTLGRTRPMRVLGLQAEAFLPWPALLSWMPWFCTCCSSFPMQFTRPRTAVQQSDGSFSSPHLSAFISPTSFIPTLSGHPFICDYTSFVLALFIPPSPSPFIRLYMSLCLHLPARATLFALLVLGKLPVFSVPALVCPAPPSSSSFSSSSLPVFACAPGSGGLDTVYGPMA